MATKHGKLTKEKRRQWVSFGTSYSAKSFESFGTTEELHENANSTATKCGSESMAKTKGDRPHSKTRWK